jgi:hypothetical protein
MGEVACSVLFENFVTKTNWGAVVIGVVGVLLLVAVRIIFNRNRPY